MFRCKDRTGIRRISRTNFFFSVLTVYLNDKQNRLWTSFEDRSDALFYPRTESIRGQSFGSTKVYLFKSKGQKTLNSEGAQMTRGRVGSKRENLWVRGDVFSFKPSQV